MCNRSKGSVFYFLVNVVYLGHHLKSVSTIGGDGDTTISSPGMTPKQSLPGITLHDPLHGRQACPDSIHFTRGLVK